MIAAPEMDRQAARQKPYLRWIVLLIVVLVIGYFAYHKGQEFWAKLQQQWVQS